MSPQAESVQLQTINNGADWHPTPPENLIFDDGEPLETNRHRIAINVLIRSLKQFWTARQNFFTGGNMFVYYSSAQVRNRDFRGPDFFVVLDVDSDPSRQGWVTWEEGGRFPDVIVELLSSSTAEVDLGAKKTLYEQVFRTRDYFVFDPFDRNSLQGWHLDLDRGYQPIPPNPQGWVWSNALELWLGAWDGTIEDDPATWLRFYDPTGTLVPLPEEFAQQAAEVERQRAEAERERAEAERERAEAERERAEAEQQRSQRLAARLRELGEDPDRF